MTDQHRYVCTLEPYHENSRVVAVADTLTEAVAAFHRPEITARLGGRQLPADFDDLATWRTADPGFGDAWHRTLPGPAYYDIAQIARVPHHATQTGGPGSPLETGDVRPGPPPPEDWPLDPLLDARARLEAWAHANAVLNGDQYLTIDVRAAPRRPDDEAFGLRPLPAVTIHQGGGDWT